MVERSSLRKPVKIIEGGKLVIPAAMRGALGIARGDMVVVELLSDGELRVRPLASPIREAQAIPHHPPNTSLVCAVTRTKVVRFETSLRWVAPM